MDLQPGALRHTDELRSVGYTHAVRRLCHAGGLQRLRRGAYVVGAGPEEPELRHILAVRAAVRGLSDEAVVSHVSAAVLHGLPIWAIPLTRVHVTRARRGGARTSDRVCVHGAPLSPGEITVVDGTAVTTPARLVVDVARTVPFEQAVVVADAALAAGRVRPADLAQAIARAARWRGIAAARRVVAFADGGGRSVGESRSRVAIARAGVPASVLQWEVASTAGGVFLVDFGWPALRTVGEFDGRVKYGRLLRPGQDAADAVYAEKLREDELRDLASRSSAGVGPTCPGSIRSCSGCGDASGRRDRAGVRCRRCRPNICSAREHTKWRRRSCNACSRPEHMFGGKGGGRGRQDGAAGAGAWSISARTA